MPLLITLSSTIMTEREILDPCEEKTYTTSVAEVNLPTFYLLPWRQLYLSVVPESLPGQNPSLLAHLLSPKSSIYLRDPM